MSVRWSGFIKAAETGWHTISIGSRSGRQRFFLDKVEQVWYLDSPRRYFYVYLVAGQLHHVVMTYSDYWGETSECLNCWWLLD